MPPFIETPPGFKRDSLDLLDAAMTKLWLQQVALGALQSGASTEVRETVDDNIRRLNRPHVRRRRRKTAISSET